MLIRKTDTKNNWLPLTFNTAFHPNIDYRLISYIGLSQFRFQIKIDNLDFIKMSKTSDSDCFEEICLTCEKSKCCHFIQQSLPFLSFQLKIVFFGWFVPKHQSNRSTLGDQSQKSIFQYFMSLVKILDLNFDCSFRMIVKIRFIA